jgi:multidrug efflux pump
MEEAPTLERLNPGKNAIIELALAGPMDTLVPLAKDLERRIERLPGISRVTIVGLQDPEVRVLVDPNLAQTHGVTLIDVVRAIEARNVSTTGAVLEAADRRSQVIVWSRFEDPEEVGDTVVASGPEGIVRARDIARIELAREDTGLTVHTNGEPGLSLVVRKREGGDAIEAVDAIRGLVEGIELPRASATNGSTTRPSSPAIAWRSWPRTASWVRCSWPSCCSPSCAAPRPCGGCSASPSCPAGRSCGCCPSA